MEARSRNGNRRIKYCSLKIKIIKEKIHSNEMKYRHNGKRPRQTRNMEKRKKKKKNKILGAIENRKDEKKKKMKTKIKGAIENIEWMKNWNVWKLVEEK